MPCQIQNPVYAAGMIDGPYQCCPLWDDDARYLQRGWNYQRRGPAAHLDRYGWHSLWPGGQMLSGDPAVPMGALGSCQESGGEWFESPMIGYGTRTTKFILGVCRDSSGAPVAGATVRGYRTSDGAFVGQVTSNDDGTYAVPTNNPASAQHFTTADKAGSPEIAGISINTLTPTNIDGT